jgi:hypothetical protein
MARRAGPDLLFAAICRWIEVVLRGSGDAFVSVPGGDFSPVIMLSSEAEQHVLEIGKCLESSNHFRGPSELVQFLSDHLAVIVRMASPEDLDAAQNRKPAGAPTREPPPALSFQGSSDGQGWRLVVRAYRRPQ